jgi:hypothetical protein
MALSDLARNYAPTYFPGSVDNQNWTLLSRLDDNLMVWMLSLDGFMMDERHAPREVQETAFNKGLIPYIPADRQGQE